jgi:hypothetical protein
LGFSPKQGSHRLSVPYPPWRGLMHLSPFKRRNCQSASFGDMELEIAGTHHYLSHAQARSAVCFLELARAAGGADLVVAACRRQSTPHAPREVFRRARRAEDTPGVKVLLTLRVRSFMAQTAEDTTGVFRGAFRSHWGR